MNILLLYHYPICPLSRQVRVYLQELNIPFQLCQEQYWQKRPEFLAINPASTVPVLARTQHDVIAIDVYPITEYLCDQYPCFILMPKDISIKCEIRRLIHWFNDKFYYEITKTIINEKVIRLISNAGSPKTELLRNAQNNLKHHLKYIENLLEKRAGYLVTENATCADIVAACHLSALDYFGEINWDNWSIIRNWYAILKSRPSFRSILQDHIPGFVPTKDYSNLDF